MKCNKNLIILIVISLFITSCTNNIPKPKIEKKPQYIKSYITDNHYKLNEFKLMMEKEDIEPIYIYIDSNLKSEIPSEDIPNIKKLVYSLLSDFGSKVKVITSRNAINNYLSDKNKSKNIFILDGAITAFDKGIFSQSSSMNLNISIGNTDNKTKNSDRFKNKKKTSQLIADFYLKQNHIIEYKSSSSILIKETNKGYSFGLNMYGLSFGVSSYNNIKDGLGLSIRKLLEASLIDLICKAIGIKSYQVMPEIQSKKLSIPAKHLSNYDFCSDMNRIVLYTLPLKNIKFNSFGMSYESEKNKLKCIKYLFDKTKNKNFVIKLKSIVNKNVNLSQAHKNSSLIRREINKIGIPRDFLITENIFSNEVCQNQDKEYCNFIQNRIEIEQIKGH
jgi:hypothetical protein